MIFKTMKREDLHKALEGQQNVLAPAVAENERFFNSLPCPQCGGTVVPIVNPKKLFQEGSLLPNFLAKCKVCECEFDPHLGIIVTRGKAP